MLIKHSLRRVLLMVTLFAIVPMASVAPLAAAVPAAASAQAVQWTLNGPAGGKINAVVSETPDGITGYAAGNGGIWKTTNSGDSWQRLTGAPTGVIRLAVNPDFLKRSIVYAAQISTLYRSTDAGVTWQQVLSIPPATITAIAVSPTQVFVGSKNSGASLHTSTNDGSTWTHITTGIQALDWGILDLDMDPVNYIWLYAVGTPGILTPVVYRSQDGGTTWIPRSGGFLNRIRAIFPQPDAFDTLFATGDGFFFKSIDGAANWISLTDLVPSATSATSHSSLGYAVVVGTSGTKRAENDTLYAGVTKGYTTNGVWTPANHGLGSGLDGMQVWSLSLWGSQGVFAATNSGVYRMGDVGSPIPTWQQKNNGIVNAVITSLAVVNSPVLDSVLHAVYAGTESAGIFKSTDRGATWQPASTGLIGADAGGDPFKVRIDQLAVEQTNPLKAYAATNNGMYRSVDGGANWSKMSVESGIYSSSFNGIVVDPQKPGTVYAHGYGPTGTIYGDAAGFFISADAGQTWNPLGVVDGWTVNNDVHAFAIGPTSFPIYAGSQNGVYRLTDPNGAWQWQSSGPALYCTSVAVDPLHPNVVYAGGSTGLTKSMDAGDTFVEIGAPHFHGRLVLGIAVDPANSDVYITLKNDDNSQNGGVWRSTDGGATWTDLRTPANISGTAIVLDPSVSRVYAGLDGLGVATGVPATRLYLPLIVK